MYLKNIKDFFTNKKNLYVFLLVGVLLLMAGNMFPSDKKTIKETSYENTYITDQEEKLKKILSNVYGAGKTDVMITYDTGVEKVTVQNSKISKTNSSNNDFSGGDESKQETTEEKQIVMNGSGSSQTPFIAKEINPVVRGVLVVSEGADNEIVSYNLTNAVAAVLDVPYHRIQVLKRSK